MHMQSSFSNSIWKQLLCVTLPNLPHTCTVIGTLSEKKFPVQMLRPASDTFIEVSFSWPDLLPTDLGPGLLNLNRFPSLFNFP